MGTLIEREYPWPLTELQVCEIFGITSALTFARIAGYKHPVHMSPKFSHFSDINIMGNDFVSAYHIAFCHNHKKRMVDIFFSWRTNPDRLMGYVVPATVLGRTKTKCSIKHVSRAEACIQKVPPSLLFK